MLTSAIRHVRGLGDFPPSQPTDLVASTHFLSGSDSFDDRSSRGLETRMLGRKVFDSDRRLYPWEV
jgi:hypothetical protein